MSTGLAKFLASFLLFAIAGVSGTRIVTSRQWSYEYNDLDGYIYHDTKMTYVDAQSYCRDRSGVLAMPTHEESWNAMLKLMREKQSKSPHTKESNWIGVTVEKVGGSEVIMRTSYHEELNEKQKALLFERESDILTKIPDKEVYCVRYSPPSNEHKDWHFEPQACKSPGVTPLARTVCRWVSVLPKSNTDPENPLPGVQAQIDSNLTRSKIQPRAGPSDSNQDGNDIISMEKDTSNTTTPLVAIVGVLIACCVVASAYYVSKKQGWQVGEMISRRMPYNNRPRVSVNGDLYARGQEMSDMSSTHRPIHVYEEIIPRNSNMMTSSTQHRENIVSCSSITTIPRDPPPEPPLASSSRNNTSDMEDGYLKPSFRRGDTIPGDVRSPPPIVTNFFTFPTPRNQSPATSLQVPIDKEIKYASVETVHTMLDDDASKDEEYLIGCPEEGASSSGKIHKNSLVVDIPDKVGNAGQLETGINPYVPVKGAFSDHLLVEELNGPAYSPIFPCPPSEYENERFLQTVVNKHKAPTKPERKHKTQDGAVILVSQPSTSDDAVVYSRIPSIKEPIYSKIKRKAEKKKDAQRESGSGPYTPMSGSGTHISAPSMISTTNQDLQSGSFYEIPPEPEEFKETQA